MKKLNAVQTARLVALFALGATIGESEAAERDFLAGLAAEDELADIKASAGVSDESEEQEEEQKTAAAAGAGADRGATIREQLTGLLSGNKALTTKLSTANARIEQLTADLAAAVERAETAEASVTDLTGKLTAAQGKVTTLEAEAKTVDEGITQALAGLNIPRADLPKPSAEAGKTKVETLQAQLDAETDPRERGKLAVAIWDQMKADAKAGVN